MLHIMNGDSTLALFGESGLPGEASVFADVLHAGPLLADPTDPAFAEARIRYAVEYGLAPPDRAAALYAAWSRGLARASSHDEVVLWFEHDLYDQLLLLHHAEWLARHGLPCEGTRVSLVCIGEFAGVPDFRGLGQLSPAQLATLFPDRVELDADAVARARRAWRAVTGPDPRAVEALAAGGGLEPFPFLSDALVRLLEEYPDTETGLSRTERLALEVVADGADTLFRAFRAYGDREARPFLGDSSFFCIVRDLAAAEVPLLTCTDAATAAAALERPADGPVALTDAGRAVLAGNADHARLSGVDRWVGGVHVRGRVPRWRWDATTGRIAGPFET